ncbi:hypothetical protein [Streptomyces sp. NPDC005303]|uniref:hypothetical protein n=1 Tax=Streptomyces sp. NPDC005303 TaxID=3155713 RepID=UPI0033BF1FC2
MLLSPPGEDVAVADVPAAHLDQVLDHAAELGGGDLGDVVLGPETDSDLRHVLQVAFSRIFTPGAVLRRRFLEHVLGVSAGRETGRGVGGGTGEGFDVGPLPR